MVGREEPNGRGGRASNFIFLFENMTINNPYYPSILIKLYQSLPKNVILAFKKYLRVILIISIYFLKFDVTLYFYRNGREGRLPSQPHGREGRVQAMNFRVEMKQI